MPIKHPIDFVKDRLISGLSLTKPALDLLAERLDEAARFNEGGTNPGLKEKERVSIPALIHRHGRLETAMMCVVVENVASAFLVHNHGVRGAIDRTLPLVSSRAMSTFDSAFDFLLGQAHTLVNAAAKSLDDNALKAPADAVVAGMDRGLRLALGEDYAVDAREHISALPERASKFVKVKVVKVKAIKDNSRLASLLFSGVVHSSVFGIFGASYVFAFTHVLTLRHKEEDVFPVDDHLALASSAPLKVVNTCTTVARVFVFDFFKGGYVQDVSTGVGHGEAMDEVFAEKNVEQYVLTLPLVSVHRPLLVPMNTCTTVARVFAFDFFKGGYGQDVSTVVGHGKGLVDVFAEKNIGQFVLAFPLVPVHRPLLVPMNTRTTVARVFVFDFFKGGCGQDVSTVVGHGEAMVKVFAEKTIGQYVLAFPLVPVHRPLLVPMNTCTTVARIFPFNFGQVLDAPPEVAEDTTQSIDALALALVHVPGPPAAPLNTCTIVLRLSDVRVWGVDYSIKVSNVLDAEDVATLEVEHTDVPSPSVAATATAELNVTEDITVKVLVEVVVADAKVAAEDDVQVSYVRFEDVNEEAKEAEGVVVAVAQISVEAVAVEQAVAEEVVVDLVETIIDSIGINADADAEDPINTAGTVTTVNKENDIVIEKIKKYENICTYNSDNKLENTNEIITIASGIDTYENDTNYNTIENPQNIINVCKVSEDLAIRDDDLDEKIEENRGAARVEGDTFLSREFGAEEPVASEGGIFFDGIAHAEHLALEAVDEEIAEEIEEGEVVVVAESAPLEEVEEEEHADEEVAAEDIGEEGVAEKDFVEDEKLDDIVVVDVEAVDSGGSEFDRPAIEDETVAHDEHLALGIVDGEIAVEIEEGEVVVVAEPAPLEGIEQGEVADEEVAVENIGEEAVVEEDFVEEEKLDEIVCVDVDVAAAGGSAFNRPTIENETIVKDGSSFKRAGVSQPVSEEGAWELGIEGEIAVDKHVHAAEFTAEADALDELAVPKNIGAELIGQEHTAAEDDAFDEEFLLELAIIEQYQNVERDRPIAEEVDVDDDMLCDELLLELDILEKCQFNEDELVVEKQVFEGEMISDEVLLELAIMEKYLGSDEEQELLEEEEFLSHMLSDMDSVRIEEWGIDVEDAAVFSYSVGEVIFDAGCVDDDEDVEGGDLTGAEEVEVKEMLVDCNGGDSYAQYYSFDQEVDASVKLSTVVEEGERANDAEEADIGFGVTVAGSATRTNPVDVPNLILDGISEEVDISEADYHSGEYACIYEDFEPTGRVCDVTEENPTEEVEIEELLTDHDNSESPSRLTRCTSMPSILSAGFKEGPTLSRCVSMDFHSRGSSFGYVDEDICSEFETAERVECAEAGDVTEAGSGYEEAHGRRAGKEKEENSNANENENEVVLGGESDAVPPAASVSHYQGPPSLAAPIRSASAMAIRDREVEAENATLRSQLPTSRSSTSGLTPSATPFVPKGITIPNPPVPTPQQSQSEHGFIPRTPVPAHWKSAKSSAVVISVPRPPAPRNKQEKKENKPSRRERHIARHGVAKGKGKGKVDPSVLASRDLNIE